MKKLTIEMLNSYDSVNAAIKFAETYYDDNYLPKPVKPAIPRRAHTSTEAVEYAQKLEVWEKKMEEYYKVRNAAQQVENEVNAVLEQYLKEQAGLNSIPEKSQAKVWQKAWDDSHSSGYYSVYQELVQLVELFD